MFARFVILVRWLAAAVGCGAGTLLRSTEAGSAYAGSQSCRECHARFYELWSTSHHGTALQPFSAALAADALEPPTEVVAVGPYRFRAEPNNGLVRETGPGGEKTYPITHAMGGKNVFYFLTPLARGRLQVLPVAYDVNRKEWYDTAASAMRHFPHAADAPIPWTDPAYTFNTSCLSCHVSQLAKNYDPATDSYRTTWNEPGINCETCHGPSAEHVRAARLLPPGEPMPDPKLIVARKLSPAQINAMCGACHAKLTPLTTAFTPGERFHDHFGLSTLEDPDFHPDGRDLGENFTMTTWGLSACAKSGQLDCVHCHTSSGRYKPRTGEPNRACLPCHEERVKNAPQHTRHATDSVGNQCVSCHMPMTEFARMRRTDHSMRPPTPAATEAFKSPNACTLCHTDQPASWADKFVREWHADDYQAPVLQRGRLIAAARQGDWSRLPEIVGYLASANRDEIWSASLLRLLRGCTDERRWPGIRACLDDPSPLVRAAAVEALGEQPRPEFVASLLAATRDDFRLVRVQAGVALAGVPRESLVPPDRSSLERATAEYLALLRARPDDATSRYNLGNFHLSSGDAVGAIGEFDAAIRLNPQNLPPFANRALAYAQLGQNDRAEASLRQALALEPGNPGVNLNLAMLLAELGRLPEAEQAFRRAYQSDPQLPSAAYNLGVMLAPDRPEESLRWCRRAVELEPRNPRYGYTLGFFLVQRQRFDEAAVVLENVVQLDSAAGDAYSLLAGVYQRRGRTADLARLYQRASERGRLPADR